MDFEVNGEIVLENCAFSAVLEFLKTGHKACRSGWNGKGMYIALQVPDEHSKMSLSYIYMRTVSRDLVPWVASQTDLLSEDWNIISGVFQINSGVTPVKIQDKAKKVNHKKKG